MCLLPWKPRVQTLTPHPPKQAPPGCIGTNSVVLSWEQCLDTGLIVTIVRGVTGIQWVEARVLLTPHSAQHGPPQPRVIQSQVSPGLPLWSAGLSGHAFLGLRTLGESSNRGLPQGPTRSSCSSGSGQRAGPGCLATRWVLCALLSPSPFLPAPQPGPSGLPELLWGSLSLGHHGFSEIQSEEVSFAYNKHCHCYIIAFKT